MPAPLRLRDQILHFELEQRLARVAEHLLRDAIRHDDAAGPTHHEERVGRELEHPDEARLGPLAFDLGSRPQREDLEDRQHALRVRDGLARHHSDDADDLPTHAEQRRGTVPFDLERAEARVLGIGVLHVAGDDHRARTHDLCGGSPSKGEIDGAAHHSVDDEALRPQERRGSRLDGADVRDLGPREGGELRGDPVEERAARELRHSGRQEAQDGLVLSLPRDVADDPVVAEDLPARSVYGPAKELHVQELALLPAPDGLDSADGAGLGVVLQDPLPRADLGVELGLVPTDELLRRLEPQHVRVGRVHVHDRAVGPDLVDALEGLLEDAPVARLALAELLGDVQVADAPGAGRVRDAHVGARERSPLDCELAGGGVARNLVPHRAQMVLEVSRDDLIVIDDDNPLHESTVPVRCMHTCAR